MKTKFNEFVNESTDKPFQYRGKTITTIDDKYYVYDIDKLPSDSIEDVKIKIDNSYKYYNTSDIDFKWEDDK